MSDIYSCDYLNWLVSGKSQKYHNHSLWLQEDQTRLFDQDLQLFLSGRSHQEHHDHQVRPFIIQNIWVQEKYMGWLDE